MHLFVVSLNSLFVKYKKIVIIFFFFFFLINKNCDHVLLRYCEESFYF